jgi:hypothetical protein
MLDGSMIVTSGVPDETTSPRLAGRSLTTPSNGAFTDVSSICCHTDFCARLGGGHLRFGGRDGVGGLLEITRRERAALHERFGPLTLARREG